MSGQALMMLVGCLLTFASPVVLVAGSTGVGLLLFLIGMLFCGASRLASDLAK